MKLEAWYILENGTVVDPAEVAPDKDGILRHKTGVAVAMRGQVPSTRGVYADEERAKAREVVSEKPKKGYSNRETKSR